jgi:hypothetical protein
MSHKAIQTTLASAVADNGTFTVGYPAGTSAGNFTGGIGHYLLAMGGKFDDNDAAGIGLSFGASSITVTYKGSTTIPAGTTVTLHLDLPGDADGRFDASQINRNTGINASRTVDLYVPLGSPDALNSSFLVANQSLAATGSLTLLNTELDVPRNVILKSAGNDSSRTATVTGKDVYGQTVIENITLSNASTASGVKAFDSITSIAIDGSAASTIEAGHGDVLGLPVFVSDRKMIIQEFEDDVVLSGNAAGKVYLPFQLNTTTFNLNKSYEFSSPVAGAVTKLVTVVSTTATVTGGTVKVQVAGVDITGCSVTIANGATLGTITSDAPTDSSSGNALVSEGSRISVVPASFGQFVDAEHASITGYVEITPNNLITGTVVAGLDPQTASTATTADVRGTYDPATACDGTTSFALVIRCLDPEFKGNQYDG